MEKNNTEKLIQDTLQKLPDYVQKSIKEVPWLDGLQKVTERRHLHIDKMGSIQTETLLMVLGLTDDVEYIGRVSDILDIKGEELESFVEEVNKEVFLPLREAIVANKSGEVVEDEEDLSHKTTLSAFEKKLNQKVHTKRKETNHSVQRSEKKPYTDPYREPID